MPSQSPRNFILIDYENVQPQSLNILANHSFKVYAFVGASQAKLPFDFSQSMQNLGENGQYVKISGNAKDALDFHIAFYIGELANKHPRTFFHIISKDRGFDPLIKHLNERGIWLKRWPSLTDIPILKCVTSNIQDEKLEKIISNFKNRPKSLPKTVKTLSNSINSLFAKELIPKEVDALIHQLEKQKHIKVDENNISYLQ